VLALDTPEALKRAHGQTVVRLSPAGPADREAIVARYADRLAASQGSELILRSDEAFVAALLAEFGTRITALRIEVPSLETVFLSLTGRDLRDRAADAREQTRAFGRRGGEHTR
jgi:ABC-2 type transport system ATP-binding protein